MRAGIKNVKRNVSLFFCGLEQSWTRTPFRAMTDSIFLFTLPLQFCRFARNGFFLQFFVACLKAICRGLEQGILCVVAHQADAVCQHIPCGLLCRIIDKASCISFISPNVSANKEIVSVPDCFTLSISFSVSLA